MHERIAHGAASWGYACTMCRSIKTLRTQDHPATPEEMRSAALQYVRKISGYREPSQKNAQAFTEAVDAVAQATRVLLEHVATA